jgi:hypothetical protein
MITGARYDDAKFIKDMSSLLGYAEGFLDGAKQGYPTFLRQLGAGLMESFKEYTDSNARVNPSLLHHIYEWDKVGSPDARLFELDYDVSGMGISVNSTFKQSSSIKSGSKVPFYDKAYIMENGIPVTISPKKKALVFDENGQTVFVSAPVKVDNPGGNVRGEYERVFTSFFNRYFTQSFLQASGVADQLKDPSDFYSGFRMARVGGKSKGISVGIKWITKAGLK